MSDEVKFPAQDIEFRIWDELDRGSVKVIASVRYAYGVVVLPEDIVDLGYEVAVQRAQTLAVRSLIEETPLLRPGEEIRLKYLHDSMVLP